MGLGGGLWQGPPQIWAWGLEAVIFLPFLIFFRCKDVGFEFVWGFLWYFVSLVSFFFPVASGVNSLEG